MLKKIVSGLMVIMLLESVMCIATVFPNAEAASSSGSEDWWQAFRHDPSHTGHSSSAVPITLCSWWNTGDKINGSIRSSPVVVNNTVFVGSSNWRIYTLNATTGSIIRPFYAGGAVESSPTVANGKVFFGSMNGSVYALDAATGNPVWPSGFAAKDSVYSSPAVADGVVYFGSLDCYVYALNAADKTEKWRFWTASKIYSSPAVSGGRVFVGVADGRVYALNVTGRCEWFYDTGQNCSSSPSVANGRVFVGSDNGKLYALNATKKEHLWNYTTGGKVKSSPAVADGCVFFGSMDGKVYALNETTGKQVWNYTTGGFVYSSPAVAGGRILVGSGDNRTYVLNATDGHHICNFTTGGPVYSSPAVAQQMVFIGSDDKKVYAFGPENKPPQPKILAPKKPTILQKVVLDGSASSDPEERGIVNCTWDFGDGIVAENITWQSGKTVYHIYKDAGPYTVTLTVTDSHPIPRMRETNATSLPIVVKEAWSMYRHDWNHTGHSASPAPPTNGTLWNTTIGNPSTDDLMYSSTAVVEDKVYIASTINSTSGKIYAAGARSGSINWSKVIGKAHSSPAVADGFVFVGDDDGKIYAINASTGSCRWNASTNYPVYSSPTVADGIVFVASTNRLYAFDMYSGDPKWPQPFDAGGQIYSSPAICDGKVYISSWSGKAYALSAATGQKTAESKILSDKVQSSPVVSHGRVFIGASNGTLYALGSTNLDVLWGPIKIGNKIDSSPAVADNTVFIGSDTGYMYAYSVDTGTFKWKQPIGPVGWSSPAVADGKVFVGSTNGKIYALKAKDGTEVWSFLTGGPVDSSPAILNGTLYVASKDGKLYAFWAPIHDAAITGVNLPTPRIDPGETVTINVTVENQGEYDEVDINVTAFYSNSTYTNKTSSAIISLAKRSSTTVPLLWNTLGVAEDTYTISARATIAIDNDTIDNNFTDGTLTIGGWHNLNVTDVWLGYYDNITLTKYTKTAVGQNCTATIWVIVENEGDFNETNILVTAYWSNGSQADQPIGTTIIEKLLTNGVGRVSIPWVTNASGIPLAYGNYTISAYARGSYCADNLTDKIVLITIPGDVKGKDIDETTGDTHKVELKDIFAVQKAYGKKMGDDNWLPNCDIKNNIDDGRVDLKDYYAATKNFGKSWPPET